MEIDLLGKDRYISQLIPNKIFSTSYTLHVGATVDLWNKDKQTEIWSKIEIKKLGSI